MRLLTKIFSLIIESSLKISMLALIFLMGITVAEVLGRYFFDTPVPGSYELTRITLALAVFFSLAYTHKERGNISVGILYKRFSPWVKNVVDLVLNLIILGLFSMVFWQMLNYAIRIMEAGEYTTVLRLPLYPWIFIASLGIFVLCLVLLRDTLISIIKTIKGEVADES